MLPIAPPASLAMFIAVLLLILIALPPVWHWLAEPGPTRVFVGPVTPRLRDVRTWTLMSVQEHSSVTSNDVPYDQELDLEWVALRDSAPGSNC